MDAGLTDAIDARFWAETNNTGIIIRRSPVRSRPPLPLI